jgi:uracil-DNA glycosylase|tara:strand:+ start:6489 stop:7172 length:684 start_codon:yes stop_codon:yes gene_type:complete
MESLNILKDKLKLDVKKGNWDDILLPFINSKAYDDVVTSLVSLVEGGQRFTPQFKDIFNAFKECDYDNLKVVIVGQDPYPQLDVADGIAFSCSKKGKTEKSLQYIFKALYGEYEGYNNDLRRWANQGVLLINTALTVEVNKIGSHYWNWKPFTEYLFTEINKNNKDIVFILMGKKAESWQLLLPNQIILKCSHPASAAYRGGVWDSNDVFSKANDELKKQDKTLISW